MSPLNRMMMASASPRRQCLLAMSKQKKKNIHLRSFATTTPHMKQEVATAAKSSQNNNNNHNHYFFKQFGPAMMPWMAASLAVGFVAGRQSAVTEEKDHNHENNNKLVLPNGLPRTCCDDDDQDKKNLTEQQKALFQTLKRIVGKKYVQNGMEETTETSQFLKGARLGHGKALYIVRPQKLKQIIEIVQEAVDADCVVLVQGQNTGLTGGSVPRQTADNRPTVIISMKDLDAIFPIDNGERVVCLGGVGLASLKEFVHESLGGRESHSILGSTFLNPTTAAGVSLGSGGTQCRKGPAFTERALYLKVVPDKFGKHVVKVVNTLGVKGFDTEEGEFDSHLRHDGVVPKIDSYIRSIRGAGEGMPAAISNQPMKRSNDTYGKDPAHDIDYKNRLCQHNGDVSRYNADTRGRDCNRSEGKVLILASVHDTFASPATSKTYWISFDSLKTALDFRKNVCLVDPNDVPVSMEYMDRDSFDVIDRSGRVLGNMIKLVGTSSPLVRDLWHVKLWIEALHLPGAPLWIDKLLHFVSPIMPAILPRPIMDMGHKKDHHVAITVGDFDGSLDRFLERLQAFQKQQGDENVMVHECKPSDEISLTAFRFVAAPAFRTWCVGTGVQGFSVDYALPKNRGDAPLLSSSSAAEEHKPLKRMRYSHFACNVVHEDLAFAPGVDIHEIKMELKKSVEHDYHGKLPAEHGHGTEYHAPDPTQARWKKMDPLNVMNPGVGGLPSAFRYKQ